MVRAEALTPADLFATLWRYRWTALVLAALGAPLLYGYSLFLSDQFTANTLVLVQDTAPASDYVRSPATLDLEARLRTLRDQVLSRTRLQAVMDRHGLFVDADSWETRLKRMRARIDVQVSRTDAFRISFTHADPVVARDVTNSLAQLFIDASAGALSEQAASTAALIEEQIRELGARLDAKEQEIAEFKSANMGSLPEQAGSNQSAISRLQQQLTTNANALAAARDRLDRLERRAAELGGEDGIRRTARELALEVVTSGSTADLAARLAGQPPAVQLEALRLHRQRLLSRYTERHPDVRMIDAEIADLEARVGTDPDFVAVAPDADTGDPLLEEDLAAARREMSALTSERRRIEQEIAEYEQRVAAAPSVERQLAELQRDRVTLSRSYDDLLGRRMEASLAGDLERSRPAAGFEVIDPAVTPERKSKPTRSLFFFAGGLLGLALGFGGGFARELLLQPVQAADELERHLGAPVLSTIPLIDSGEARRRRLGLRVAAVSAVLLVGAGVFVLRMFLQAP